MKPKKLKAPYPYFGGKSRVAPLVWRHLGDVTNYIEPFVGSGAMLIGRPHEPQIETVNDIDCYVSNFWRAIRSAPEAVASFADSPVNEADLHARHRWLVGLHSASVATTPFLHAMSSEPGGGGREEFRVRMRTDPDYFDPQIAGWWCWGLCCWIGGGWCTVRGMTSDGDTKECMPRTHGDYGSMVGVNAKLPTSLPDLSGARSTSGRGVHGSGINAKIRKGHNCDQLNRPMIGGEQQYGMGVNQKVKTKRPVLGGDHATTGPGKGVNGTGPANREGLKRPAIGDRGGSYAIHQLAQQLPFIGGGQSQYGMGIHAGRPIGSVPGTCAERLEWLVTWFKLLADRWRTVRVCCGHWKRVCDSESVTTRLGICGMFLDPPYSLDLERLHAWIKFMLGKRKTPPDGRRLTTSRDGNLYASDVSGEDVDRLVAEVHVFCLERGHDPRMRIVLAGLAGEHDSLVKAGWQEIAWSGQGGYGNRSDKGKQNAKRERLWVSPNCERQRGLFE